MPSSEPLTRLRDIVENVEEVVIYTKGLDSEAFNDNAMVRDAVERCLTRISEAAVKLGDFAEIAFPEHPWINIRRLGNLLRHAYHDVDTMVVWSICSARLQPMRRDIETFLKDYPADQTSIDPPRFLT